MSYGLISSIKLVVEETESRNSIKVIRGVRSSSSYEQRLSRGEMTRGDCRCRSNKANRGRFPGYKYLEWKMGIGERNRAQEKGLDARSSDASTQLK